MCGGCLASPRAVNSAHDLNAPPPATFEVDGAPFCFVGANNYYVSYKPKPMVDDVLVAARAMGVKVVRIWAFIDRGSLDGSIKSTDGSGSKDGVYFQAWDPRLRRVAYNDGALGLERLDYVLSKADQLGLKVVLVLTNNWPEFGGVGQYLAWYGLTRHRDFFTDVGVKRAFQAWMAHLVSRENTVNHRVYRDDPTIFAWELMNEPRVEAGARTSVLTSWASEMSSYLKSLDSHHLVAVGDEGFLDGGGDDWPYQAHDGVDHRALTDLQTIDYGTFHAYPQTWGMGFPWTARWISVHLQEARALGKPSVLEEYGVRVSRDGASRITTGLEGRLDEYRAWNQQFFRQGGSGAMFWLLAGAAEDGRPYPDFDHYTVYRGDETGQLLAGLAAQLVPTALACRQAAPASSLPSPFARVRRAPRVTAFGWRSNDG